MDSFQLSDHLEGPDFSCFLSALYDPAGLIRLTPRYNSPLYTMNILLYGCGTVEFNREWTISNLVNFFFFFTKCGTAQQSSKVFVVYEVIDYPDFCSLDLYDYKFSLARYHIIVRFS